MNKYALFLIMFFAIFGLISCKKEGVTLHEAAGFEIENIDSANCNTSIASSYAWEFQRKFYKHLDVEYEITDFNINEIKMDASLIVYVQTNKNESTIFHFFFFNDYIYLENAETNTNYVSIKKTYIDYSKVWTKN